MELRLQGLPKAQAALPYWPHLQGAFAVSSDLHSDLAAQGELPGGREKQVRGHRMCPSKQRIPHSLAIRLLFC